MKLAVFTDIHGNLEALKAIINDIKSKNVDEIICLGDTIGLGSESKECLDLIIENNIKIEREKQRKIEDSVMTIPILKILYEFWIVDSYDPSKVNRNNLFKENKNLINYKNNIFDTEEKSSVSEKKKEEIKKDKDIIDLNLPGINDDIFIDIDGKKYIK